MKAPEDTKSPLLFVTKEDDEDQKVFLVSIIAVYLKSSCFPFFSCPVLKFVMMVDY